MPKIARHFAKFSAVTVLAATALGSSVGVASAAVKPKPPVLSWSQVTRVSAMHQRLSGLRSSLTSG